MAGLWKSCMRPKRVAIVCIVGVGDPMPLLGTVYIYVYTLYIWYILYTCIYDIYVYIYLPCRNSTQGFLHVLLLRHIPTLYVNSYIVPCFGPWVVLTNPGGVGDSRKLLAVSSVNPLSALFWLLCANDSYLDPTRGLGGQSTQIAECFLCGVQATLSAVLCLGCVELPQCIISSLTTPEILWGSSLSVSPWRIPWLGSSLKGVFSLGDILG